MKITETLANGKNKVVKFCEKHKTGIKIAAGVVVTAVIGGVIYIIHKGNADVTDEVELELPDIQALPEVTDTDSGFTWNNVWKEEEYRENWDKVIEFAQTIDLKDGETYMIERNSEFDDVRNELGLPTNIVSHFVNYIGSYPENIKAGEFVKLNEPDVIYEE